jgi:hypothetical protein
MEIVPVSHGDRGTALADGQEHASPAAMSDAALYLPGQAGDGSHACY